MRYFPMDGGLRRFCARAGGIFAEYGLTAVPFATEFEFTFLLLFDSKCLLLGNALFPSQLLCQGLIFCER